SGIAASQAAATLADRERGVFAVVGIHPHQAGDTEAGRVADLAPLLRGERVVAVGETGLDFFRDYAPRRAQRELFARELELAHALQKPVVVHARSADDATAESLAGFDGTVVLHCFSSPALMDVALERSYYV